MNASSRILIMSPFGVFPPRSGGHSAILEPARILARTGMDVTIFGYGVRRFEAFRYFRSFLRPIEPNLKEYRYVSIWNWVDYWQRGRTGIPPVNAAKFVSRSDPKRLRDIFIDADVVHYECPWLFPYYPVKKPRLFLAQNIEARISEKNRNVPQAIRERIALIEQKAWRNADLVLCLTREDRDGMISRYGSRDALILPAGVDSSALRPPTKSKKREARLKLCLEGKFVVLFTGSQYLPNRSALTLMETWSKQIPDREIMWVAAGSVGQRSKSCENFIQTGELPDLTDWFHAADCCINPLVEGSGMNVKMLEFLAHGLPVVSTPFGARGIEIKDGTHALIREAGQFPQALQALKDSGQLRRRLSENARRLIEEKYSWEAIGKKRYVLLQGLLAAAHRQIPEAGRAVPSPLSSTQANRY
jgi:glycosyltransferase involved in cell wall biosynthesis